MKYLEESNKNLISLRTSLIAVVALLTGGLVGLILTNDFSSGRLFITKKTENFLSLFYKMFIVETMLQQELLL